MTSLLTRWRRGPAAIRERIRRLQIGARNIIDAFDRERVDETLRYGPDGRPTWQEDIGGEEWQRRVREEDHT